MTSSMFELSLEQEAALIRIAETGVREAAWQLSALLNLIVHISIPGVQIVAWKDIGTLEQYKEQETLAYVSQTLSKDLEGTCVLIFQRQHTSLLTEAVIGTIPEITEEELWACQQEAMLEIGNIVISTCIRAMVNMLTKSVELGFPCYNEDYLSGLLQVLFASQTKAIESMLSISIQFNTSHCDLHGSLLVLLTAFSTQSLLKSLSDCKHG